jgi:hypothetical protein
MKVLRLITYLDEIPITPEGYQNLGIQYVAQKKKGLAGSLDATYPVLDPVLDPVLSITRGPLLTSNSFSISANWVQPTPMVHVVSEPSFTSLPKISFTRPAGRIM